MRYCPAENLEKVMIPEFPPAARSLVRCQRAIPIIRSIQKVPEIPEHREVPYGEHLRGLGFEEVS